MPTGYEAGRVHIGCTKGTCMVHIGYYTIGCIIMGRTGAHETSSCANIFVELRVYLFIDGWSEFEVED